MPLTFQDELVPFYFLYHIYIIFGEYSICWFGTSFYKGPRKEWHQSHQWSKIRKNLDDFANCLNIVTTTIKISNILFTNGSQQCWRTILPLFLLLPCRFLKHARPCSCILYIRELLIMFFPNSKRTSASWSRNQVLIAHALDLSTCFR